MQSLETKSSRPRPKSFETETETKTRPETFETEAPKTGLVTRLETETKSRDPITGSIRTRFSGDNLGYSHFQNIQFARRPEKKQNGHHVSFSLL